MSPSVRRAAGKLNAAGAQFVTDGSPRIRTVAFSDPYFGDEQLAAVVEDIRGANPSYLSLEGTAVTDASAATITRLGSVRQVSLPATDFTIAGIRRIAERSPSIRHIYVSPDQVPGGKDVVFRGVDGDVEVHASGRYDYSAWGGKPPERPQYAPERFRRDIERLIAGKQYDRAIALLRAADLDRQLAYDGQGYVAVGRDVILLPGVYADVVYDPARDWCVPATSHDIQDMAWQAAATRFAKRYNLRRRQIAGG